MRTPAGKRLASVAVIATAMAIATGLSGCLETSSTPPSPSPTSTPTTSSSPSAVPTATPSPSDSGTRFAEDCGILLTPAQVYDYNPNYVADTSYAPKAGSIPAQIAAAQGQTCGWLDETSGALVEVAIATPGASSQASAKAAAAGGTPISVSGEQGFFGVKNGVGSAQFFFGSIWLDVSSTDFATVADAQQLYPTVVQNQLKAGG